MILGVDMQSARPIYEQLRDQIVLGIASGALLPDEVLPSVRRLAADIGINLHTVNKAYSLLGDEGYIVMDRRRGATVRGDIPKDAAFDGALSGRLTLAAAEARCRGATRERFLRMCADCWDTAAGKKTEGVENE